MANRKLTKLDIEAEAVLWRSKAVGNSFTNAEAVRLLATHSKGRLSYRKLWPVVRRARRRVNRKYNFVRNTTSRIKIPEQLLRDWIEHNLLTPANYKAVVQILVDYDQYFPKEC